MTIRIQLLLAIAAAVLLLLVQTSIVGYLNFQLSQSTEKLVLASNTRLAIDFASDNSDSAITKLTAISSLDSRNFKEFTKSLELILKSIEGDLAKTQQGLIPLELTTKSDDLQISSASVQTEYLAFVADVGDLGNELDMDEVAELTIFIEEALFELVENLGITNQQLSKVIEQVSLEVQSNQNKPLIYGFTLALIISVLLGVFGVVFAERIVSTINNIVLQTEQVAKGRLNAPPLDSSGKSELALLSSSVNIMTENLRGLVLQLQTETSDISKSSKELSKVAQNVIIRNEAQSNRVDHTQQLFHELITTAEDINRSTISCVEFSEKAAEESSSAKDITDKMTEVSFSLRDEIAEVSEGMQQISEQTKNIITTLSVIGSISDQTNLLALNAAIESARAGEAGRGFAVVADEVRTLAKRTQASSKEIKEMIDTLFSVVEKSNQLMANSAKSTHEAAETVQQVNNALSNIFELNQEIDLINGNIASKVDKQHYLINQAKITLDEVVLAEGEAKLEAKVTESESEKLVQMGNRISITVSGFEA